MSIFTPGDLASIKADRLLRIVANYFPDAVPTDSYIMEKLLAEEVSLETRLRTLFSVREILPSGALPAEAAALTAAGASIIYEPGYDYDPRLFSGDAWGLIALRHKPIVAVHSVVLAYPNVDAVLFTIPAAWIRAEAKYGRINIVPSTDTAISLPANAYILSALGGGRVIPFMVQVRYSAGMPNIRAERPDIVDLIKRLTIISILDDQFFPTSGSDSIDGLSQSLSIDTQKYRDIADKRFDAIESSLNGIRFMAL